MPCFCTEAAARVPSYFSPQIGFALPAVPLQLKLAVALPAMAPEQRLDLQIDAILPSLELPSIGLPRGGLMDIAASLSLMSGTFPLDDLPALEMALEQAATSVVNHLWPMAGWLSGIDLHPLLNMALAARLVLDLQEMGLDPFAMEMPEPPRLSPMQLRFALTPAQVTMARLVAGLPTLAALNTALDLPPLGEEGAMSGLMDQLHLLSSINAPKLGIALPQLMKLALVLNSLATITAAFGTEGLMPSGLGRIRAMLTLWRSAPLQIPFPMPVLALQPQLAALPALEAIDLGAPYLGLPRSEFALMANFSMPKLAFMPVANLALALGGSMQLALDMDPFDACSLCPCA